MPKLGAFAAGEKLKRYMSDSDRIFDKLHRRVVVAALGVTQIFAWGSTFYLLGVLGHPIALDTGWSYELVVLPTPHSPRSAASTERARAARSRP